MAVHSGTYTLIYRLNLARPRLPVPSWPDSILQVQVERARLRRDGSLGMTEPISLRGAELPSLGPIPHEERQLLELLRRCPRTEPSYAPSFAEDVAVAPQAMASILQLLAERPHLWDRRGQPIRVFPRQAVKLAIQVVPGDGLTLRPSLQDTLDPYAGYPYQDLYDGQVVLVRGQWAYFRGALYPLASLPEDPELRRYLSETVRIPPEKVPPFVANGMERLHAAGVPLLGATGKAFEQLVTHPPTGVMTLREQGEDLICQLAFDYSGVRVPMMATGEIVTEAGRGILRNAPAEARLIAQLKGEGFLQRGTLFLSKGEEALEFLYSGLPRLLKEGWALDAKELHRLQVAPKPASASMRVKTGLDWFSLDTELLHGKQKIDPSLWGKALAENRRFVRLEGEWVRIPPRWLYLYHHFKEALELSNPFGASIPLYQAPLAFDWIEAADKVQSDSPWQRLAERWKQFEALDEAPLPDGFKGELRPYQRHGLAFLLFLREHGFHGILADDMGLGKTVQAIALLATPTDEPSLPSLVIAPTSVVYNWEQELSRFAPHLRVLSLHGPSRKEHFDRLGDYDVILTSFALMRRDSAYLEKQEYSHLILDEAQAIKNPASQTSKLVRRLQARHRFSLTGTPLENHLGELWAQFAFLMPGLFGSERQFQERYLTPINAGQEDRLKELRARSNPFILRRLKKEVAKDLPPRTEIVAYCELDPAQREIYDRILADVRAKVMKTVESQGMERSHITILDGLLRLRQICCHPRLMSVEEPDISSKLDLFMELVEGLLAEGHRALVFSQFVKMLELVSKKLNEKGIPYEYLDGRTRDRQARVDRFNNSKTPLFLISLKAGGTGLNLTGADYVIHFDPWWNPAVEAQATDRAHRIGQSKQVFSYKLIARDSIEEKVLKLQERKKALISDIILSEEGMAKQLSRDDLDFLFK